MERLEEPQEQSSKTSSPVVLPAKSVQLGNCLSLFFWEMELKRTGKDQLYGDLCLHVNSKVLFCCQLNQHQMPSMGIPSRQCHHVSPALPILAQP